MNRQYSGIDRFRLAAALLVVAIHTSPLASFSETADFVLTRIVSRTAVPFFFMNSGFFLISHYADGNRRLCAFLKKTARVYAAAVLLYLPVNLYTGYFRADAILPKLLRDIVFDGTMYHLWYLPAAMAGASIAWYLVRRFDYRTAFMVTAALYGIALFGDSCYGFIENIYILRQFYLLLFQLFDHTRNGLLFAPLFFVLGGRIAERRRAVPLKKCACGFALSLALMAAEALTLRAFQVQRHDSMYLLLPLCVYFLFNALLHFRGKGCPALREISLLVYLIHPIMILAVRALAKLTRLEWLLIENSAAHYLAVCLASLLFSFAANGIHRKRKPRPERADHRRDRAYIELNLRNLEHNVDVLRKHLPSKCAIMAVVKTNAYGHGAYETACCLERYGVRAFAVATAQEGIRLRRCGIRGEILILGYTDVTRAAELKKYRLTQTILSAPYAAALNRQGVPLRVHLKIDTGMHRLGIASGRLAEARAVFEMESLRVCGIYTHLSCSDSRLPDDIAFTKTQIKRFYSLIDQLKASGIRVPPLHIQSSYGIANYLEITCDYARAGLALYGVPSVPGDYKGLWRELRPVLALRCRVVLIREIPAGDAVGYHRSFVAERPSRIAVLSIGYGDGVPKSLSDGRGRARIGAYIVPIVGQICMDQLTVDITDTEGIRENDIAALIDPAAPVLSAAAVAEGSVSISNSLLCRLGARLPVVSL